MRGCGPDEKGDPLANVRAILARDGWFAVRIDLHDGEGVILTTALAGPRMKVTNARLLGALFVNPLVMFKVLTLIHYQAVRLLLKGVGFVQRPPSAQSASRSV